MPQYFLIHHGCMPQSFLNLSWLSTIVFPWSSQNVKYCILSSHITHFIWLHCNFFPPLSLFPSFSFHSLISLCHISVCTLATCADLQSPVTSYSTASLVIGRFGVMWEREREPGRSMLCVIFRGLSLSGELRSFSVLLSYDGHKLRQRLLPRWRHPFNRQHRIDQCSRRLQKD